jgi:hypothetical protein
MDVTKPVEIVKRGIGKIVALCGGGALGGAVLMFLLMKFWGCGV